MSATCSAAILARNEASNLPWALRSAAWCDELVVLDMDSEDATADLARAAGARVMRTARLREFDQARRELLEACRTDWVLLLDADEMVPTALAATLQRLVRENGADVVEVPFCNYLGTWRIRSCGWWPDYHPRLFRRTAAAVTGHVHDYLTFPPEARRVRLPADPALAIHHFSYRDVSHFAAKMAEYTYLESARWREAGRRPSALRALAAPVREFLRRYVGLGGVREGWRGFSLALLLALYRALLEVQTGERWGLLGSEGDIERLRADLSQ